ncbi:MAG: KDO2-lipid IV(A) lauroyltransferase [Flavobacteriales bacterium]|jgi:KDO2-lipid IV(A) lauroyltransferase
MGAKLLYYLFLKPISLLPYFLLYRVSDFIYFLFMTVFPYRKKVVIGNIERSFPEKSKDEHKQIRRKFYRHLADLFVESFKNFSISKSSVDKRLISKNQEVFQSVFEKGKGVVLCGGHYNNWELYALGVSDHCPMPVMAIYKRLSNKWFDGKMRETRGKFGLQLVPTIETSDWMERHKNEPFCTIYGFDQSPANPKKAYWSTFLNQDTAMYYGPERHAKQFDMAVVYGKLRKTKRGHYTMEYELVTERPNDFSDGEIIEKINGILEGEIKRAPEYWLWTHKRWKHKRPAELIQ